jgi:3beta-hydroxy-delta5-steroid dehydrogenase/steroid delta-isomerase
MITNFIVQLAAGSFKATIGSGSAEADNTHVENLVDAQILAAQKLVDTPHIVGGEAYYITDEEPMNALEWFRPLVEGLGYTFPSLRLPAWLMYGLGFLGEVAQYLGAPETPLTRMGVLKVARSHSFRTDRARRELGYRPSMNREQGMAELLPYAREMVAARNNKQSPKPQPAAEPVVAASAQGVDV